MKRPRAIAALLMVFALGGVRRAVPNPNEPTYAWNAPVPGRDTLADTVVIARVNDRTTTVAQFRDSYWKADPTLRPGQDSLSRADFLQTLVDKDVLGLTAQSVNKPLALEDRIILRSFTESLLARTIYDRRVKDPVKLTQAEVQQTYPQYSFELKLRNVLFGDRATAERVRLDLIRGRIGWDEAARRYGAPWDTSAGRDLGWVNRARVSTPWMSQVFGLKPLSYSAVLPYPDGFRVWQCVDRRPVTPPPFIGVRLALAAQLRAEREMPYHDRFFQEIGVRAQAQYDTANIAWLADEFDKATPKNSSENVVLDLTSPIPRVAPSDTGRVLAITHGVPFTVREMLSRYRSAFAALRGKVGGFAELLDIIQRMVLEPDIAAYARERGLERDPEVARKVEAYREGLMVSHLYSDSVESRVRVSEEQRRAFYEANRKLLLNPERARYVMLFRTTEAGADSLLARLSAGARAEEIGLADSLAGLTYGTVREITSEQASRYRQILLVDLKPGQSTKVEQTGGWYVLHVLEHIDQSPQTYREAYDTVDQGTRAAEAERLLNEMLVRLRRRYTIESYPTAVMRFSLFEETPDVVYPRK